MLVALLSALILLAAQEPRIVDHPGQVFSTLQPTQMAQFWVENGGDYTRAAARAGNDRITFQLWVDDVYVSVEASGCGPGDANFASCDRFNFEGGGLRRQIDLRKGVTVAIIDQVVLAIMLEIEAR